MILQHLIISMDSKVDPATQAWLNVLPVRPNIMVVSAVDTFIKQCKTDGNWNLLDRFWLFGQDVQANIVYSLPNPTSAAGTLVNSPTFVASSYIQGNGTSSYFDTNFNLATDAVNFVQNGGTIGIYETGNSAGAVVGGDIGAVNSGNNRNYIYLNYTDGKTYHSINATADTGFTRVGRRGTAAAVRTSSTNEEFWYRGSKVDTQSNTSSAPANLKLFVCCINDNGTAGEFVVFKVSCAWVGSGAIDQAKFHTALEAMATTIGFQSSGG